MGGLKQLPQSSPFGFLPWIPQQKYFCSISSNPAASAQLLSQSSLEKNWTEHEWMEGDGPAPAGEPAVGEESDILLLLTLLVPSPAAEQEQLQPPVGASLSLVFSLPSKVGK